MAHCMHKKFWDCRGTFALAEEGFARRSQSAGGFGEAERSERGGGGGWGAEGRSEPFQGSHQNESGRRDLNPRRSPWQG
jgi:hypothetical protein